MPFRAVSVLLAFAALTSSPGLAAQDVREPELRDLPHIEWSDNREPAGTLEEGRLRIHLEVARGLWQPEGPRGVAIPVLALREVGEPLQIPGPMIRVPEGTEIVATVRNPLGATLGIRGLSGRRNPTDSGGRWIDPTLKLPAVMIPPGQTRELRFLADAQGTYMYEATTMEVAPAAVEPDEASLLGGALIVDPPGGGPADNETVMVMQSFDDALPVGVSGNPQTTFVINGRPWPHTERLTYDVGDSVTWRVINASWGPHPMHLHGFFYEIESRGDIARDTLYWPAQRRRAVTEQMEGWTTMKVTWSPDRPGGWIFHCHSVSHVFPNPDLTADPAPTTLERLLHLQRTPEPIVDPTDQPSIGMGGLVMGIYVRPPEGWTPEEPIGEPIQLHVREDSVAGHYAPRFGYAIGLDGEVPPEGEVPFPGPPLVLQEGAVTPIRVVNDTDEPTTTHWHGLEVESLYDGVAGTAGYRGRRAAAVMPGDSFDVALRTDRPGTYIYHTHMSDTRQLTSGLYGPLIVLSDGEEWNPETDRIFIVGNGLGEIEAPPRPLLYLNGSTDPDPMEMVAGTEYRLRLINITLDVAPGLRFRLVRDGSPVQWTPRMQDGWRLPAHRRLETPARQKVGVGETYDFTFTPSRPGELHLEIRSDVGELRTRQLIRVLEREAGEPPAR